MSIWTDLLFLGGYVATPTGLTALAPNASTSAQVPAASASPPACVPAAPARAPIASPPATAVPARHARELRPLPRANKISPSDLW